jgi:hypothetical protein
MPVESTEPDRVGGASSLKVQLIGPLAISRDGVVLALPASRKVRALIAYLALARNAVTRSQLCELLWDVPDDPRGELRWCLSKVRRILDQPHQSRIDARDDTVRLDLSDCHVDAIEIARATQEGLATLAVERLRTLSALFAGDFLEGLEIDRSPVFRTGSLRNGAATAAAIPRYWSISSAASLTRRPSAIWRSSWSSLRSTCAFTRHCSMRSRGEVAFARVKSICRLRHDSSKPTASIRRRFVGRGARPGHGRTHRRKSAQWLA